MRTLSEARGLAEALGRRLALPVEELPLTAALHRTLADELHARCPLPGTDSSAMDGWAVAGTGPWRLDGAVRMGRDSGGALTAGTARRVTTGAALPRGTTSVLRTERGTEDDEWLRPADGVAPREGVDLRRAGEELATGDPLGRSGDVLTPALAAAAAASGHDTVLVRRPPRVALLTLGDELVPSGLPAPGQVRDVLGLLVPPLLGARGAEVVEVRHVRDDGPALAAALDAVAAAADVVVTAGGTGHGRGDHLVPALEALGAVVELRGVAVRPGHPTVLARLDAVPVVGLPGNPFAAVGALVTVAAAVVGGALGRSAPPVLPVRAAHALPGTSGCDRLVTVRLGADGVAALDRQGPGAVTALLGADGLAVVPPSGVAAGAVVEVVPL